MEQHTKKTDGHCDLETNTATTNNTVIDMYNLQCKMHHIDNKNTKKTQLLKKSLFQILKKIQYTETMNPSAFLDCSNTSIFSVRTGPRTTRKYESVRNHQRLWVISKT